MIYNKIEKDVLNLNIGVMIIREIRVKLKGRDC